MQDSLQIKNIQPLIPPEEVAFWPPAPGWYVIAALILLFGILMLYKYLRYRSSNRYRRVALHQISEIEALLNETDQRQRGLLELNSLLKRVALKGYFRAKVASLSGKPWTEFLDASCKKADFNTYPGDLMQNVGYQDVEVLKKMLKTDINQLLRISKTWIAHHKN